ncbi:hypothetical protein ACGF5C_30560 [Micromonospora sp. NPDC047620]|uniref:hypothetical protein n=1 Tax=Micromonospora sp. NPDC047620 TaxID=3364251 RepID=UPI00371E8A46
MSLSKLISQLRAGSANLEIDEGEAPGKAQQSTKICEGWCQEVAWDDSPDWAGYVTFNAVTGVSAGYGLDRVVRPKGLEPLTF